VAANAAGFFRGESLRNVTNIFLIGSLLLFAAVAGAQQAPSKSARKHHASSKHHRNKKSSWKRHGQQGITPDRARDIQAALIRQNYLTGEPTGVWDARSQAAMVRYQGDNGWQTKVTPDSRALIKLGLGPNYSDSELLNKTDGATTALAATGSANTATAATRDKQ
jgi:hypothetical protein